MKAYLVAGLAYGDEGKGATVDYLVKSRNSKLVVRYNGGAQALHNVVLKDGRHHCFSQFGSGTFTSGVYTFLSKYVLVNPLNMLKEEQHLRELGVTDAFNRTIIDDNACIITPFHKALNRLREYSRKKVHGSCGEGIGETRNFQLKYGDKVLYAKDLSDPLIAAEKLQFIQQKCLERAGHKRWLIYRKEHQSEVDNIFCMLQSHSEPFRIARDYKQFTSVAMISPTKLIDHLHDGSDIIFEGAQGVLLDEKWGEPQHNTWTDCTYNNAVKILSEMSIKVSEVVRVGVLRSYFTRHGEGKFEEDQSMNYPEPHNSHPSFQGRFRIGKFDAKKVKYALDCLGGVDMVALNHLDIHPEIPKELKNRLIKIKSYGPTAEDRKE